MSHLVPLPQILIWTRGIPRGTSNLRSVSSSLVCLQNMPQLLKKLNSGHNNHLDPHVVTQMPKFQDISWDQLVVGEVAIIWKQNLIPKLWAGYIFLNNWLIGSFILATFTKSDNSIWQWSELSRRRIFLGQ